MSKTRHQSKSFLPLDEMLGASAPERVRSS